MVFYMREFMLLRFDKSYDRSNQIVFNK